MTPTRSTTTTIRRIREAVASANLPGTLAIAVPAGSHAYGLATETSDLDVRAVFCADPKLLLGLRSRQETTAISTESADVVGHELGKFCRLALRGNPSALEILWASGGMWTETGIELRALRGCFLQHGILRAYAGYAADQMRRLESQKTEGRGKTAMHLLRLLISARHLAETGDILVDVSTHRDRLLAIRNGAIPLDHAKEEANAMLSALQQRISGDAHRLLPAQARSDIIEQFVVSTRLKQMGLQEPSPDQTRRPGRTTEPTTSSDHSARSGT